MLLIAFGKSTLVLFMAAVMGTPMRYYLKRDAAYEATAGQPKDVRLRVWNA